MKKSIPLKEIVGFLPYELNIKTNNLIRKMVIETSDLVYVHQITRDKQVSISNVINGIGHKPIVRPLSDLTKEITHNGETFVPLEKMIKKAMNEYDQGEGCFLAEYIQEFSLHTGLCVRADLGDENYFYIRYYQKSRTFSLFTSQSIDVHLSDDYLEQLREWHFDIYDWIKDGLGIDINTI